MAKNDLNEKLATFRFLESRLQNISNQREVAIGRIAEINSTIQSLDEIEKSGGDVLFPIGSSAYTFAKITEKNKVIVDIGANVGVEKDFSEAKKTLEKNKVELEKIVKEIEKAINETSHMMEELAPEIESETEMQKG